MKPYQLHEDLIWMEKVRIKKYTKLRIGFANLLFTLSLWFFKRNKALKRITYRISGHHNKPFKMVSYQEKQEEKRGALLYFHGGGFFLKGTGVHLRLVQKLALMTNRNVFFVHYHLALKHPFPHALMDCYHALKWVREHAESLHIDPNKIALMGDSAGGNLAAATALYARDHGGPIIEKIMLLYPVLDVRQNTKSMEMFVDAPIWNSTLNRYMWEKYLRKGDFGMLPYASPSLASLDHLPMTYIETAEYDCLRDEAILFEEGLKKAGVPVTSYHTKGSVHGYDALYKSGFVLDMVKKRVDFLNQ